MKNLKLVLILTTLISASVMPLKPAEAVMLQGGVQHNESFARRDYSAHVSSDAEGRIGVRITSSGNVNYVHPGSPAANAGIRSHDVVLRVDGRKHNIVNISGEPGTEVELEVKRGFQKFCCVVTRVDFREIMP